MDIKSLALMMANLIAGPVVKVIFAIGAVLFVWGVVKYFIINADEEAKRNQGKQFMLWGIIVFVVISSIWGIVRLLASTFGLQSYTTVLPGLTPKGGGAGGNGGGGGGGGTINQCRPACSQYQTCVNGRCVNPPLCPNQGNECRSNDECLNTDAPLCVCGACMSAT